MGNKLFGKCLLEKPGNNRQVLGIIIGKGRRIIVFLSLPDSVG